MPNFQVNLKNNPWANGKLVYNNNSATGSYQLAANNKTYSATNITQNGGGAPVTFTVNIPPQYVFGCSGGPGPGASATVRQPIDSLPSDSWGASQQGSGVNYSVSFTSNNWADGTLNTQNSNYNPTSSTIGSSVSVAQLQTNAGGAPTSFQLSLLNASLPPSNLYVLTFTGGPGGPGPTAPVAINNPAYKLMAATEFPDTWDASAIPVPLEE